MTTGNTRIRQYWDSCLFIAFLKDRAEEKALVDEVGLLLQQAQRAKRGDYIITVSSLVLAEVRPYTDGRYKSEHAAIIEDLFETDRPYIRVVAATGSIGKEARKIGVDFGLSVADSIHVATALQEQVDVMFTTDGSSDTGMRRSHKLLTCDGRIGTPPLKISEPKASLGPLWDGPANA